jgi:hypothetical protein
MNEILKNLKEEALVWATETLDPDELNDYEWGVAIDQKFAELIVRECAKVGGDFEYARLHDSLVEDHILKHFGVEE